MGAKFVRFAEVCKYLSHRVTELSHIYIGASCSSRLYYLICNLYKKQEPQFYY